MRKIENRTVSTALFQVKRESEKAVAFSATAKKNGRRIDLMVWIPKSMIQEGRVPMWKLVRSLGDAGEYYLTDGMPDMVSARTGNALDVDEMTEIGLA